MGLEVTSTYIGALTVKNIHGPSGAEIKTTAPLDNGGTGDLFSPTDLIATSLGSCMLTIMGLYAENNGININEASVRVEKSMAANLRRISKLDAEFSLSSNLTDVERRKLEAAAKTCPVKQSLHPETELVLKFNYNA